ncbi:MAG: hypothetical protein HC837_03060 [Chloroflexaceae bacterium]|nr:hypothetical protein [Chloroflexaceae bacterium]
MLRSFLPSCLPIVQSGMPHGNTNMALRLLLGNISQVVTWPRLPAIQVFEQLHIQSASGFPGLVVDQHTSHAYVDRTVAEHRMEHLSLAYLNQDIAFATLKPEYAVGLNDLLHIPEDWPSDRAICSQLIGPLSLALQLTDEQHCPLIYDRVILDALAQYLSLRSAWISHHLADITSDSIICLDEPWLHTLRSPFLPIDWDDAFDLLEQVFAGMKSCHGLILNDVYRGTPYGTLPTDWLGLFETSVELLLVNVYDYPAMLIQAAASLPAFFERGGSIAWGLIPANPVALLNETTARLIDRFQALFQQLMAHGVHADDVLKSSFISTSDSLEHLSVDMAEQAIRRCVDVSAHLRRTYQMDGER